MRVATAREAQQRPLSDAEIDGGKFHVSYNGARAVRESSSDIIALVSRPGAGPRAYVRASARTGCDYVATTARHSRSSPAVVCEAPRRQRARLRSSAKLAERGRQMDERPDKIDD